ncbi:MAG: hypothetical protein AAB225_30350 [Acidobacteriota bacterium]
MGIERWKVLVCLALLGVVAYLPSLSLPFISDDYVQIKLGRDFGAVSGWPALAADALYRCRATSLVLTYWTDRFFGLEPLAYNLSSLFLHILNTWLVFALGGWRVIGWRVSALAAAFFAVYLGHCGAVIWYAALPELLVFFFSLLCLLCWIRWLESGARRWGWYAASLALFLLALASKESAVAVVGLLLVAIWFERAEWRKRLLAVVPFACLAAVYFALIYSARSSHLFFGDGTFSLNASFWIVLLNSAGRLFWFSGMLGLLAIRLWQDWRWRPLLWAAGAWIVITFLPYSFLTYMPRVPSRHTYWASAGLALVVGAGFLAFYRRFRRSRPWAVAVVATLIVAHNCGYLWFKKRPQYLERAAPTEALIEFASKVDGTVYVHCFPYALDVAVYAVELRLNKPVRHEAAGCGDSPAVFCWRPRTPL